MFVCAGLVDSRDGTRAGDAMSNATEANAMNDPVQRRAFELLMSGEFSNWKDLQRSSSVDDDAVMGLVGIGLFDLQFAGEIFNKQNQRVVEFEIRCKGHWMPMFFEELKSRSSFDFSQFGHFNYGKREACVSIDGIRALDVTRKEEPGDARWYIKQRWGRGAKPELRFTHFSVCEESDSKPAQTVMPHDNGVEIAAAIKQGLAELAGSLKEDQAPAGSGLRGSEVPRNGTSEKRTGPRKSPRNAAPKHMKERAAKLLEKGVEKAEIRKIIRSENPAWIAKHHADDDFPSDPWIQKCLRDSRGASSAD